MDWKNILSKIPWTLITLAGIVALIFLGNIYLVRNAVDPTKLNARMDEIEKQIAKLNTLLEMKDGSESGDNAITKMNTAVIVLNKRFEGHIGDDYKIGMELPAGKNHAGVENLKDMKTQVEKLQVEFKGLEAQPSPTLPSPAPKESTTPASKPDKPKQNKEKKVESKTVVPAAAGASAAATPAAAPVDDGGMVNINKCSEEDLKHKLHLSDDLIKKIKYLRIQNPYTAATLKNTLGVDEFTRVQDRVTY